MGKRSPLIPSGYRLSTSVGKNSETQAFQFINQQIPKSSGNQWNLSVMLLSSGATTSCYNVLRCPSKHKRLYGVRTFSHKSLEGGLANIPVSPPSITDHHGCTLGGSLSGSVWLQVSAGNSSVGAPVSEATM